MAKVQNWEDIENALVELSGKQPRLKGDEHIHTCPLCHKDEHLYVNYEKGVYNCYRCGGDDPNGQGGLFKLAEVLGVTVEVDDLDLTGGVTVEQLDKDIADIYMYGDGVLPEKIRQLTYTRNEMPLDPPKDFVYLTKETWLRSDCNYAIRYLEGRGFTSMDQVTRYRLGVAPFYGKPWLIIPDFNGHGQVRWWQRRNLTPEGPRYLGPEGDKAGKLGNWYQALAQPVDYIGVCEGPISGMLAGYEFCWLWGKEFSREQIDTLVTTDKKVLIALDGEDKAFNNAIGLATELRSHGVESLIIPMPGQHDPASLGHAAFRQLLDATLRNSDGSDLDFLKRVVEDYVR